MRYPASEKLEIIRLVERSHLPAKRTFNGRGTEITADRVFLLKLRAMNKFLLKFLIFGEMSSKILDNNKYIYAF